MKYHTLVSRVREQGKEVLDVVSGGLSLAHNEHGVCNPSKDAASPWWLDLSYYSRSNGVTTTGGRPLRPHTHFISSFSPLWRPRSMRRQLPSNYLSPSSSSSVPLFFSPKKECALRQGGSSCSRGQLRGDHTDFCQRAYPLGVL